MEIIFLRTKSLKKCILHREWLPSAEWTVDDRQYKSSRVAAWRRKEGWKPQISAVGVVERDKHSERDEVNKWERKKMKSVGICISQLPCVSYPFNLTVSQLGNEKWRNLLTVSRGFCAWIFLHSHSLRDESVTRRVRRHKEFTKTPNNIHDSSDELLIFLF